MALACVLEPSHSKAPIWPAAIRAGLCNGRTAGRRHEDRCSGAARQQSPLPPVSREACGRIMLGCQRDTAQQVSQMPLRQSVQLRLSVLPASNLIPRPRGQTPPPKLWKHRPELAKAGLDDINSGLRDEPTVRVRCNY